MDYRGKLLWCHQRLPPVASTDHKTRSLEGFPTRLHAKLRRERGLQDKDEDGDTWL